MKFRTRAIHVGCEADLRPVQLFLPFTWPRPFYNLGQGSGVNMTIHGPATLPELRSKRPSPI